MVNCSGLSSFNCYLAAQQPTLGHYQGDSLTHPMLITAFLQFQPEGHPELSKDGKKLKLDTVTTEKWLNDCSEKIPQSNNGKSLSTAFLSSWTIIHPVGNFMTVTWAKSRLKGAVTEFAMIICVASGFQEIHGPIFFYFSGCNTNILTK